jgi:hypothetical protein
MWKSKKKNQEFINEGLFDTETNELKQKVKWLNPVKRKINLPWSVDIFSMCFCFQDRKSYIRGKTKWLIHWEDPKEYAIRYKIAYYIKRFIMQRYKIMF